VGEAILAAIRAEVPEYARPLTGAFGRDVRRGVDVALRRFVDALEDPNAAATDRARDVYVGLGRGEARAGRSLDALLAAYRVGARVSWRRIVDAATAGGLPPDTIYDLGEAVFAYIDEISAESVEGYTSEQSRVHGERERRRRSLARLLAADPPAPPESVRAEAERAGWRLPERLAALVAEPDAPRWPSSGPRRARACSRRCAPTSTSPASRSGWPTAWACTPRRSGIACADCATCCPTVPWRTPTRASRSLSRCAPRSAGLSSRTGAARSGGCGDAPTREVERHERRPGPPAPLHPLRRRARRA